MLPASRDSLGVMNRESRGAAFEAKKLVEVCFEDRGHGLLTKETCYLGRDSTGFLPSISQLDASCRVGPGSHAYENSRNKQVGRQHLLKPQAPFERSSASFFPYCLHWLSNSKAQILYFLRFDPCC